MNAQELKHLFQQHDHYKREYQIYKVFLEGIENRDKDVEDLINLSKSSNEGPASSGYFLPYLLQQYKKCKHIPLTMFWDSLTPTELRNFYRLRREFVITRYNQLRLESGIPASPTHKATSPKDIWKTNNRELKKEEYDFPIQNTLKRDLWKVEKAEEDISLDSLSLENAEVKKEKERMKRVQEELEILNKKDKLYRQAEKEVFEKSREEELKIIEKFEKQGWYNRSTFIMYETKSFGMLQAYVIDMETFILIPDQPEKIHVKQVLSSNKLAKSIRGETMDVEEQSITLTQLIRYTLSNKYQYEICKVNEEEPFTTIWKSGYMQEINIKKTPEILSAIVYDRYNPDYRKVSSL